MSEYLLDILPLAAKGYCCSQILGLLALQAQGAENPGLTGEALANKAIEANTWQSIEDLFKQSPMIRDMVKSKAVKVVGAVYDIESGKVNWMGEHPKQAELVELTGGAK